VLTALVLLGAFLATLFLLDPRIFAVLVAAVLAIATHEWMRLSGIAPRGAAVCAIGFGAAFALLALAGDAAQPWREWSYAAAGVFWLLCAPLWLSFGIGGAPRGVVAAVGLLLLAVAGIAALSLSPLLLFLVLGLVWIADTAAFFAGNAFGRHRLAPAISPGKTWEGVAGAVAATLVYAIIFAAPGAPLAPYARQAGWAGYLGAVVLLCAVSVLGDLFESAVKRQAGMKDSGSILPGHGGVLDRLDSVLPTLPIAALLLHWSAAA
jgi:phosphatidate cytidylyltransferase